MHGWRRLWWVFMIAQATVWANLNLKLVMMPSEFFFEGRQDLTLWLIDDWSICWKARLALQLWFFLTLWLIHYRPMFTRLCYTKIFEQGVIKYQLRPRPNYIQYEKQKDGFMNHQLGPGWYFKKTFISRNLKWMAIDDTLTLYASHKVIIYNFSCKAFL